jgi:hypothetical protein
LRALLYIAATFSLGACGSKDRDAAMEAVNRHIPDSRTARYGRLYHLKTEGGYDCIDVTFQRPSDRSTVRSAALLERRGADPVVRAFDQGNTCEELPGS